MIPVNANSFGRAMLMLLLLMLAPAAVLADAGHDAKKMPAAMEEMDHSKMKMGDTAATEGHWMAPEEAAKRPNVISADKASRARGKQLFKANCVSCHGAQGRGDGPAAAALNPKPADLTAMAGQHADGDFAWKIANGRGPMPAWKGTLTENQIWDLVNFIQSLKKPGAHGHDANHHH